MSEMDQAYRADCKLDNTLRMAEDLMRELESEFVAFTVAAKFREMGQILAEERARIVRRWD